MRLPHVAILARRVEVTPIARHRIAPRRTTIRIQAAVLRAGQLRHVAVAPVAIARHASIHAEVAPAVVAHRAGPQIADAAPVLPSAIHRKAIHPTAAVRRALVLLRHRALKTQATTMGPPTLPLRSSKNTAKVLAREWWSPRL